MERADFGKEETRLYDALDNLIDLLRQLETSNPKLAKTLREEATKLIENSRQRAFEALPDKQKAKAGKELPPPREPQKKELGAKPSQALPDKTQQHK